MHVNNGGRGTEKFGGCRHGVWACAPVIATTQPHVVTGKGVVGFCPTLAGTGGCFQYMSNVPLNSASGRMGGFFTLKRQDNTPLDVPLPTFEPKPLPEDVPSAPAPTA